MTKVIKFFCKLLIICFFSYTVYPSYNTSTIVTASSISCCCDVNCSCSLTPNSSCCDEEESISDQNPSPILLKANCYNSNPVISIQFLHTHLFHHHPTTFSTHTPYKHRPFSSTYTIERNISYILDKPPQLRI